MARLSMFRKPRDFKKESAAGVVKPSPFACVAKRLAREARDKEVEARKVWDVELCGVGWLVSLPEVVVVDCRGIGVVVTVADAPKSFAVSGSLKSKSKTSDTSEEVKIIHCHPCRLAICFKLTRFSAKSA